MHVCGTASTTAVKTMMINSGIQMKEPSLLKPTQSRHRACTFYERTSATAAEKEIFYNHMGHSGEINRRIYQYPPAEKVVRVEGQYLQHLDS